MESREFANFRYELMEAKVEVRKWIQELNEFIFQAQYMSNKIRMLEETVENVLKDIFDKTEKHILLLKEIERNKID